MPTNLVKTPRDEKLWAQAKAQAKKQGKGDNWAYINSIYQNMKGHKKSAGLSLAMKCGMAQFRCSTGS
jgi:hypothetical protein